MVDLDLESFFDRVNHDLLMRRVLIEWGWTSRGSYEKLNHRNDNREMGSQCAHHPFQEVGRSEPRP